ncbi:hypothetical protein BDZ91DRAFT_720694 [Kalaharituber pfeilii]|nr:hypothetical protein BDZ91DRAFT_720694 [Kalaharituber pfeilii]
MFYNFFFFIIIYLCFFARMFLVVSRIVMLLAFLYSCLIPLLCGLVFFCIRFKSGLMCWVFSCLCCLF